MNERLTELIELASDSFTHFQTGISGDHRYIHEGKAFSIIGNTGSVASGSSYSLAIKTPVDTSVAYIHLRPAITAATTNVTSVTVAEGSTITGGSAVVPINLNRNSINKSKVKCTAGVTVSAAGTTIYQDIFGAGGATPARAGGSSGAEHERVLKPDTIYSITFTVIGATTASTAYFDVWWYEEPNG